MREKTADGQMNEIKEIRQAEKSRWKKQRMRGGKNN